MSDQSFVDQMVHVIPFLIALGVVTAGLFVYFGVWKQLGTSVPAGVEEKVITDQILDCFVARDELTGQPTQFDAALFTQKRVDECLEGKAYRLKVGEQTVKTKNLDDGKNFDKAFFVETLSIE